MNNQASQPVAKRIKSFYRAIRAGLLSIGLQSNSAFSLTDEERRSSNQISVIVAVHDGLGVTRRCLNSLEIFGGSAEVIVVDDGSKLAEVRRMLGDCCARNSWKLVRRETALGHSRASEAGVTVSTKPYVCLLNSDAIVTPRSWWGVIQAFESSPQVAVVGPSTSQTPTAQQVTRALHCRRYWKDGQIWAFAEKYVAGQLGKSIVDLPMAGGFAFFIRRNIWDKFDGFDKNLPDYGNESELCRRLKQSGFRVVWTKASYIHHLGSETYGRTLGIQTINKRCLDADSYIQKKWAQ